MVHKVNSEREQRGKKGVREIAGSVEIGISLAGLTLRNPTMPASGVLGTSASILRKVADSGAGALVTKSVGPIARAGYPNPTVIQVEGGLLNAVGLANPGINEFCEEIEGLSDLGIPIISSVYGFSPEEYAETARKAEECGSNAIELNLSCPHVKGAGAEMGRDPNIVESIVRDVRESVSIPLLVKLTPNVANIADLAVVCASSGADAITAVNTFKAMAIDVETCRPVLANKFGGLSGGAIKPLALRCVYDIFEAVDIPIIGCGGIMTWEDAVEFILAGASAVQIGSAIAFGEMSIFRSICKGLDSYLKRKGYRNVRDIIGLVHRI